MTTFRRVVKLARVTGLQPSSIPYGGTEWVITYYYDLTGRLVRQTEVGSACEYDVHPKVMGQNRGMERIIMGNGVAWYTPDHYMTFFEMR